MVFVIDYFVHGDLTCSILVDALSSGASLRVLLEPDPGRKVNLPHYWEVLDLPLVVAGKSHFWAMTYPVHHHQNSQKSSHPISFCYTSSWRLFASYEPVSSRIAIMPRELYRFFAWGLIPQKEIIWDSSDCTGKGIQPIVESIRRFKKLYVCVFLNGYVFFLPVHFPAFYPEMNTFTMMTEKVFYPEMFNDLDFSGMQEIERTLEMAFHDPQYRDVNAAIHLSCNRFDTFFSLSSDGFCSSPAFGEERGKYDRLIVFADKADSVATPYVAEACQ